MSDALRDVRDIVADQIREKAQRRQDVLRSLPSDAGDRKGTPIMSGVLDYFPLAMAEIARVSKSGNDQHNPGQPLHWARGKSSDHADCIVRHLIERGTRDSDGMRHTAKVAWRALALLQEELEAEAGFVPGGGLEGFAEATKVDGPMKAWLDGGPRVEVPEVEPIDPGFIPGEVIPVRSPYVQYLGTLDLSPEAQEMLDGVRGLGWEPRDPRRD